MMLWGKMILSLRYVATNDAMMTPHSHLGMLTKREKRKRGAGTVGRQAFLAISHGPQIGGVCFFLLPTASIPL